jgi:hypothetical protein
MIPKATEAAADQDLEALQQLCADCYDDPLGFTLAAFPWKEEGTPLEDEDGPDRNQTDFLKDFGKEIRRRGFDGRDPVMPIQMAIGSGHGTGKSAMGGWITSFLTSTRPDSIGTVTAGTGTQLKSRTWAAIRYWMALCLTSSWFDIQASGIFHKRWRDSWKVMPQTCRKENAQAFAGQHSKRSTSWYLFDEASEVGDPIWVTAYGGLTDGESMIFAWGQPVRNTGQFHEVTFGKHRARWNHRRWDSRTSRFTNKQLIAQWAKDYGEDSDFFKVRVLGLPPKASELQYIDKGRVDMARGRTQFAGLEDPLIAGFDVSGGGAAMNVIRFRRGLDGRVRDPIRLPGDADPDRNQRVGICAELLRDTRPEHRLAALFVDAAFGAPIVARLQGLNFANVYEVNFGGDSPEAYQRNMRAYMYSKAKDWLVHGSLPDEDLLCDQLIAAGYHIDKSGKLVIEPKEDVLERMGADACMDDNDAFLLTFAQPVKPGEPARTGTVRKRRRGAWA